MNAEKLPNTNVVPIEGARERRDGVQAHVENPERVKSSDPVGFESRFNDILSVLESAQEGSEGREVSRFTLRSYLALRNHRIFANISPKDTEVWDKMLNKSMAAMCAGGSQEIALLEDIDLESVTTQQIAEHLRDEVGRMVDPLTGLFKREFLHGIQNEYRGIEHREHADLPCKLTVITVDLDNFKKINDDTEKGGHAVGDKILSLVAHAMMRSVRLEDRIVRTGGDEFMIIAEVEKKEDAVVIAKKMHTAINEIPEAEGLGITASIGVAVQREGQSFEEVQRLSDRAAYISKNEGRNQVTVADENLEKKTPKYNTREFLRDFGFNQAARDQALLDQGEKPPKV